MTAKKSSNKARPKIAFLGGDMRTLAVAKSLSDEELDIFLWGVECDIGGYRITLCDNIYRAIEDASAVILPLPASKDGCTLNCEDAFADGKPTLGALADAVEGAIIIGGKLPPSFVSHCEQHNIPCFDYFESEAFQIKNAYTTAEAALSIAMNSQKKNIKGSRLAISGYGRIGKQLTTLLLALGADVTVCARNSSDLAWAALKGADIVDISTAENINILADGYDIIFNTVPARLFSADFLSMLNPKTLIIDLASSPGGVDISQAKRLRKNVLWATSLPGKYAPESAGELIAECIGKIIHKEVDI